MANLKNPNATKHDYEATNCAFPGKIRFSDLDGHVEIGGRHLFMEVKHPTESLASAVVGGLKSLAAQGVMRGGRFVRTNTVVVVRAEKPFRVHSYQLVTPEGIGDPITATTREFNQWLSDWVPPNRWNGKKPKHTVPQSAETKW